MSLISGDAEIEISSGRGRFHVKAMSVEDYPQLPTRSGDEGGIEPLGRSVTTRGEQRLADLYGRFAPDALRVAFLLTSDQHAAEDIVQDAFVRLFSRFQELRNPDAFETYLRRTVVNLSRDRWRRLKLERDHAARQTASVSSALGISSQIEARELIRESLQKLPHRQRAVLVLRFYTDLSEQQTAEVMQCSVAAVKSLAARATASLRKEMGGDAT